MTMQTADREAFYAQYLRRTHLIGRAGLLSVMAMLIAAPFLMGAALGAQPDMSVFGVALLQVALVYFPSSIVEFLVYTPMLGAGGGYLAFLTGNLINMKIPCVANARGIAGVEAGTPENEIVSALSVATSALVTTAVVALGVLLLIPLQPVLQSAALRPAFDNVVPALFGAMAYQYFRGRLKLAAIPLLVMSALCVLVPSVISSVGFLIIPSGALAIGLSYLAYKRDAARAAERPASEGGEES